MDLKEIKQGDILAYRGDSMLSKTIESMTNSQYSHLCIYISDGFAIEADGFKDGIVYVNIEEYKDKLDVYTCNSLTEDQRVLICNYAISHIGGKYDYLLLFILFLKYIFKLKIKYKDSKSDICSELVNDSYKKAKIKLSKKKYPSPQEVISSKLLVKIGSI